MGPDEHRSRHTCGQTGIELDRGGLDGYRLQIPISCVNVITAGFRNMHTNCT